MLPNQNEESTDRGWAADVGWQWSKIKKPFDGETAESQSIVGMAADKTPQEAGHPEVKGSQKEERGGQSYNTRAASPTTERTSCPGRGLTQA